MVISQVVAHRRLLAQQIRAYRRTIWLCEDPNRSAFALGDEVGEQDICATYQENRIAGAYYAGLFLITRPSLNSSEPTQDNVAVARLTCAWWRDLLSGVYVPSAHRQRGHESPHDSRQHARPVNTFVITRKVLPGDPLQFKSLQFHARNIGPFAIEGMVFEVALP